MQHHRDEHDQAADLKQIIAALDALEHRQHHQQQRAQSARAEPPISSAILQREMRRKQRRKNAIGRITSATAVKVMVAAEAAATPPR